MAKAAPGKAPKSGKGSAILARVTQDLRGRIDREAERTGRSISQVAEMAIERGLAFGELGAAGPAVADTVQAMLRAAVHVRNSVGDPGFSLLAREELRRRWGEVISKSLTSLEQPPAGQVAMQSAISAVSHAAADAFDVLVAIDPGGERSALARDYLLSLTAGGVAPGSPEWPEAHRELLAAARELGGDFETHITALLAMADAMEKLRATASLGGKTVTMGEGSAAMVTSALSKLMTTHHESPVAAKAIARHLRGRSMPGR